jgi:hypothetical protein
MICERSFYEHIFMEVQTMLKSRRLRDVVFAGLLVLFIFAATLCAQSPADNELLKMIPAKSLFCIRVNNFDYTLNQIDQFLAGVSPMPMVSRRWYAAREILGFPVERPE